MSVSFLYFLSTATRTNGGEILCVLQSSLTNSMYFIQKAVTKLLVLRED